MSRISFFDLWSSAILIIGVWSVMGEKEKKWNAIVIFAGIISLIFGVFSPY